MDHYDFRISAILFAFDPSLAGPDRSPFHYDTLAMDINNLSDADQLLGFFGRHNWTSFHLFTALRLMINSKD